MPGASDTPERDPNEDAVNKALAGLDSLEVTDTEGEPLMISMGLGPGQGGQPAMFLRYSRPTESVELHKLDVLQALTLLTQSLQAFIVNEMREEGEADGDGSA